MFRGGTPISLDNKGRLAVPAKYREDLLSLCGGRLVITADPSKCLLVYPHTVWEPIEQKLNSLSSFNPQTRSLQRLLVGNASDVDMDGAGRILVPPPLRHFAGLTKDVVLVGQGAKLSYGTAKNGISKSKMRSLLKMEFRRNLMVFRCKPWLKYQRIPRSCCGKP